MRFPPPEIVASWPPPNYINPVSRGPTLLIVEFITLSIALLCLGMRMYVRLHIMRKSGWDDWLMVGSAVFGTGVTTCVVLAFVRYGWAIHVWDLTPSKMIAGRQVSFAAQALFVPATSLAKVSILVNYYRLAPRNSWFHHMIVASMVFVVVLNIIFLIILFTECIPVSSYWNLLLYDRDCVSEAETLLAQASTTAIADFVVWVLPMPWLYRAKLPLRQRLAVIALFSFGLFVVIAACIRAYWIHYIVQKTYDVTWYGFHLWMWTAVEVHLGIICACVPWIKSLYKFNTNKRNVTEVEEITDKAGESSWFNRYKPKLLKASILVRIPGRHKSKSSKLSPLAKRESVGKVPTKGLNTDEGETKMKQKRDRNEFADLERGSTISEMHSTPQTLPADTPGLAL